MEKSIRINLYYQSSNPNSYSFKKKSYPAIYWNTLICSNTNKLIRITGTYWCIWNVKNRLKLFVIFKYDFKLSIFCSLLNLYMSWFKQLFKIRKISNIIGTILDCKLCPLFHIHYFVALQSCVRYCNSCINSHNDITFDGHKFHYIDISNLWL